MPIALPEWRQGTENGTLAMMEEGLRWEQSATAPALLAPLFIDLDPRRFTKPLTWRQLTVAEELEILPPHVVAAFRVQVGKKHWLFYRSLAKQGNRTVLGHNLCSEFLAARVSRKGEIESLLEIE
jgi:hypothetical protein